VLGYTGRDDTRSNTHLTVLLACARSISDISYQASADYGRTWSPARFLSTSPDGKPARNDQFLATIAADPDTGHLHAIWDDSRTDPAGRRVQTFQAFSADDGRTWVNANISSRPWNPALGFRGAPFVGDTQDIDAAHDRIYPVWNDARDPHAVRNRHGGLDIFTNAEPGGSPVAP